MKANQNVASRAKINAAKPAPPMGDIRFGPVFPIPELLREFGYDPASVLASVGVDIADFDDPDNRLPFEMLGRLVERCSEITGRPHFGLLIGARFDFASLGAREPLVCEAPSVEMALRDLIRHVHLNDRGGMPFLQDLGSGHVAFGYVIYHQRTPGVAQVYDMALANCCIMLRGLCGPSWKPTRILISHPAPRDTTPYRHFFGAPVEFNSTHSEIIFSSRWLQRPLAGAIEARRATMPKQVKSLEDGDDTAHNDPPDRTA